MRSFEERIAEIHRRSEKIIQQRRRRRRQILTACIPLVLCLGLFTAFILPAMMPAASKDMAAPENMLADASGGRISPVSMIKVSGPNLTLIHTQLPDVLRISDYISDCTMEPPSASDSLENNGALGREEAPDFNYGDTADTVTTGYLVTLVMENGSKTEYFLEDALLINSETNQTYPLSKEKLTELKALLGIPLDEPPS